MLSTRGGTVLRVDAKNTTETGRQRHRQTVEKPKKLVVFFIIIVVIVVVFRKDVFHFFFDVIEPDDL